MTWIKPSFMWMMYRSSWGTLVGQDRILAVDISTNGFELALADSCMSHFDPTVDSSVEEWQTKLKQSPVRIQWDPERSVSLQALPWRAIQIGLRSEALNAYVDSWIVRIEDVTPLAHRIKRLVDHGELAAADAMRPAEFPIQLPSRIAANIGVTEA